jgi:hypothetical protein
MKFWKLLTEAGFTGSPSKLTQDELRQMGKAAGLSEPQIEAVPQGFLEFLRQEG